MLATITCRPYDSAGDELKASFRDQCDHFSRPRKSRYIPYIRSVALPMMSVSCATMGSVVAANERFAWLTISPVFFLRMYTSLWLATSTLWSPLSSTGRNSRCPYIPRSADQVSVPTAALIAYNWCSLVAMYSVSPTRHRFCTCSRCASASPICICHRRFSPESRAATTLIAGVSGAATGPPVAQPSNRNAASSASATNPQATFTPDQPVMLYSCLGYAIREVPAKTVIGPGIRRAMPAHLTAGTTTVNTFCTPRISRPRTGPRGNMTRRPVFATLMALFSLETLMPVPLSAPQIAARIAEVLGPGVATSSHLEGGHPWVAVAPAGLLPLARFLRDDPQLRFDILRSVTGLDYPDKKLLAAAYDLMSFEFHHEFCLKVFVPRDQPLIPSVSSVWHAADWHEREAWDLLGINFTDHPDSVTDTVAGRTVTHPRRILLPDDWDGFPLRKDYAFPSEYHGIPGTVETDWEQKPNYPK